MADGVAADPAIVNRQAGELVAGVAGEAKAVGMIVQAGMHGAHAEGEDVASLEIGGEPAAAQLLAEGDGVAGQAAAGCAQEAPNCDMARSSGVGGLMVSAGKDEGGNT